MDAVLRHLCCGHDLRDFPGTATERLALVRTAHARGLIAWTKSRARYELTSAGWSALRPTRRFGLAALILTAATGAMAGAVAAAVFWLPADASRAPARWQSAASVPNPPRTSRSAQIAAPVVTMSLLQDAAAPAAVADTSPGEEPDRPSVADRPAAEQPRVEVPLNGATEAEVKQSKKPRHKAHHRRREQGRTWARANLWRAQRYAGYGGQRGWFGY